MDHPTPPSPFKEKRRSTTPPRSVHSSSQGTPLRRFSSPISRSSGGGDRFIPNRESTNLEGALESFDSSIENNDTPTDEPPVSNNNEKYVNLLRSELLGQASGVDIDRNHRHFNKISMFKYSSSPSHSSPNSSMSSPGEASPSHNQSPMDIEGSQVMSSHRRSLSRSFVNSMSSTPSKPYRKIPKLPYKVLDAPGLLDDFYLNLVDWSSSNVLAVALGTSVYTWSASTAQVHKLHDFDEEGNVSSVSWSQRGDMLAVGSYNGAVSIWDVQRETRLRRLKCHESRVGVSTWSSSLLATGSRDRHVLVYDLRVRDYPTNESNESTMESNSNQSPLVISPLTNIVLSANPSTSTLPAPDLDQSALSTLAAASEVATPWPTSPVPSPFAERPQSSLLESPSGSRARYKNPCIVHDFHFHKQEVCGLKWSFDEKYLASGGNDNKLFVWSVQHGHSTGVSAGNINSRNRPSSNSNYHTSSPQTIQSDSDSGLSSPPLHQFNDHLAAVKAVAWSPHNSGLLSSGGGTADRHIRFWNVLTGTPIASIDTESQVCNLIWSKTNNEFVSTHGYSLNQIIVWKYPTLQKLATLTGHTYRILYLSMSPDGQTIVTGAGDETLRFWNVFPPSKHGMGLRVGANVILSGAGMDIR